MKLSAVVPVGPKESLQGVEILLSSFKNLKAIAEVILSGVEGSQVLEPLQSYQSGKFNFKIIQSSTPNRAFQINEGIKSSVGNWFWVLHVDSDISDVSNNLLSEVMCSDNALALYHFQLAFKSDGPPLTFLNAKLANVRSRYLKLPFGDQGFLFSKKVYEALGPFDELAPFGEDHLYVWKAHQERVPVIGLPAYIKTSARKYKMKGWGATTRKHVYLSFKQGTPEFFEMLKAWKR